jgi:hypothetical protein
VVNEITSLDDLVGPDIPACERERLEAVDALLRSLPGPPSGSFLRPQAPRGRDTCTRHRAREEPGNG